MFTSRYKDADRLRIAARRLNSSQSEAMIHQTQKSCGKPFKNTNIWQFAASPGLRASICFTLHASKIRTVCYANAQYRPDQRLMQRYAPNLRPALCVVSLKMGLYRYSASTCEHRIRGPFHPFYREGNSLYSLRLQ